MEIGKYAARPLSFEFGKTNDKDCVVLRFRFSEGPNKDKQVTYTGWLHQPAVAKRTMESLEYCGWDGNSLAEMKGFGTKEVELDMQTEEYEGETRVRVAWVNRLFGYGPKESYDKSALSDLDARLAALNAERKREQAERRGGGSKDDPFGNG